MSLRTALGLGGLFAVTSVLSDQIEHQAAHLLTVQTTGWTSALAYSAGLATGLALLVSQIGSQ